MVCSNFVDIMLGQERSNCEVKFIESVLLHALYYFHAKWWTYECYLDMCLEINISKPKSNNFDQTDTKLRFENVENNLNDVYLILSIDKTNTANQYYSLQISL